MARDFQRREVIAGLAAAGGVSTVGAAAYAATVEAGPHANDWAWLEGDWDVWNRRLRKRLAGSDEWDEFAGKSAVWLTLGGLGTIDDNTLDLPGGTYRAAGIRAFDPKTGNWSIWWLDGRNPTRIDPPVTGRFEGDGGTFTGEDAFNGRPISVRFRWHDIHSPRPHWEQAFSPDDGATWEVNWRNYFTRTAPRPTPLPVLPDARGDWSFLVGRWRVRHRKLKHRLAGSTDWEHFGGAFENWPLLGGNGNVGDNLFEAPSGTYRGIGIRAFDPASGQWSSWWLDGRDPSRIAPPVRGAFSAGGDLIGDDMHEGRPVKVRVRWSGITATSARWEQAFSADGGQTWEINWVSEFTRRTTP